MADVSYAILDELKKITFLLSNIAETSVESLDLRNATTIEEPPPDEEGGYIDVL